MGFAKEKEVDEKSVVVVDWLELPEHITSNIMSKLISIYDYASFSVVCVQWQSIFREKKKYLQCSQVPLLMIPTPPPPPPPPPLVDKKKKNKYNNSKKKNKKKKDTISCSFYRVTDGKIFNRLRLAMPRDRYVRGSGYGWLITVDADEMCFSIQLMNPFFYPNYSSNKEIKLPPLISHPLEEDDPEFINYTHLRKAVLSADPVSNPKDFMVMAIFFGIMGLAFCKPGDEAWTPIESDYKLRGMFYDLVYYQGKFYALHCSGTIVLCNVEKRTMETFARPPLPEAITSKKYLVVSEGELFQVHRYIDNFNNSERFRVFKLQRRELAAAATDDWVVVKDLCDRVFFVGDNSSISISASDFPGCKPNRIYYTDDDIDNQWWYRYTPGYGPRDFGVFNVQNGSFERHYPTDFELWPAPIWIEPTLIMQRSITCSKPNVVKKPIVSRVLIYSYAVKKTIN